MTIYEARKGLQDNLTAIYDTDEAGNIAEWVIENVTGLGRNDRISDKNKEIEGSQANELEKIQQRLLLHEPVQYVLNDPGFVE